MAEGSRGLRYQMPSLAIGRGGGGNFFTIQAQKSSDLDYDPLDHCLDPFFA